LYIFRKEGKMGLIQIEEAYVLEIMGIMEYVECKDDALMTIARTHKHRTN
jgi:hypothetical protein